MLKDINNSLELLESLNTHLEKFISNSTQNDTDIAELLLEFDLVIYQLSSHAETAQDVELLNIYSTMLNNLEVFENGSATPTHLELICAWPLYISEFISNRNDPDIRDSAFTFLNTADWPTKYTNPNNDVPNYDTDASLAFPNLDIPVDVQQFEPDPFLDTNPENPVTDQKTESAANNNEEQEFLELINAEIIEIQETHSDRLIALTKNDCTKDTIIDIIETQNDQLDRIGTAAEMIGLHGLHSFCVKLSDNLEHIKENNPHLACSLHEQLMLWPDILQAHLFATNEQEYIQTAIDYLIADCWPTNTSEEELHKIQEAFNNSAIEIDKSEQTKRIQQATTANISLEVPEDVPDELINSLLQDLPEQTEEFSSSIQNLNNNDYLDQLEIAKRIAHTLKGAGNTVGIVGLANLTHNLEDILEALLKAKSKPSEKIYNILQNAADCLEEMSECLQGISAAPSEALQVFQSVLDCANHIDKYGIHDESLEVEADKHEETVISTSITSIDTQIFNATSDKKDSAANEESVENTLRVSANLIDDLLKHVDESLISNAQIQEFVSRSRDYTKQLRANNSRVKALIQELEHIIEIRGFSSHIDKNFNDSKFDPLEMDQFNELHTYTNQLIEASADSIEFSSNIDEALSKLDQLASNQGRVLVDNQEAVLRTRMVPVKTIVLRLKRSVRQACKLLDKSVQLEIEGEETLIDNEIMNQLVDPLMHILRNAVDHGIEPAEYRSKRNKSTEGSIKLSFKKEGRLIYVKCEDDGRGLDIDRIKEKAIERNLIQSTDDFSEREAIQTILQHGFSTKEEVSQLSGRGVGLDIVFENIREMKGIINLDSSYGHGMKIELSIPTTFHTTHALLISVANNKFAISNRGIEEILYPGAGAIIKKNDRQFYQYQQKRYKIFNLQSLLYADQNNTVDNNTQVAIIVKDDLNQQYAVFVDKILDTREIVVKPLSKYIPKISGILGTTILGDGSATSAIDLIELIIESEAVGAKKLSKYKAQPTAEARKLALIVEDSISTRKSLAQYMSDLGFKVETAKDGVEAIDKIQKQVPELILTDLEMPRMNGLELTEHLRGIEETSETPIIMITSRATDKHKQEAVNRGVSEYLTKPYDEDSLFNAVQALKIQT